MYYFIIFLFGVIFYYSYWQNKMPAKILQDSEGSKEPLLKESLAVSTSFVTSAED